jgi:predicted PolB exonuclease-like 3'-5' exonuclease
VNVLVFDIETIPDTALGRRLHGLDGLSDAAVARAMFTLRRQSQGTDFLAHPQHRIVAISCALRSRDGLKLWSLGEPDSSEEELVRRFFDGLERFSPDLVSWNGGGFDLPVLQYRALRAGIRAERYWETGDSDTAFRYNNYLSRFHWRHMDLMDILAGFQGRARAPLVEVAALLGLPGKLGFSGAQVWDAWLAGEIVRIRQYCETDVLNTYLIYLRFELMRGRFTAERYAEEVARVKTLLAAGTEPHLVEFLRAWEALAEDPGTAAAP